jgi:hypothetical protein
MLCIESGEDRIYLYEVDAERLKEFYDDPHVANWKRTYFTTIPEIARLGRMVEEYYVKLTNGSRP